MVDSGKWRLSSENPEAFLDKQREVAARVNSGALDQMAGRSIGMVEKEEPIEDIIKTLVAEANSFLHANS
jgi:hypothetical protein